MAKEPSQTHRPNEPPADAGHHHRRAGRCRRGRRRRRVRAGEADRPRIGGKAGDRSQPESSGGADQGRKAARPQGGQDLVLPRHPLRGSGTIRTAQAGPAVDRHQERPGVGPGLPESRSRPTVGADELVFPHRYWIANEHCQYLNVWTQNLTPAVKKPVMVWMHGGGFTNGSSMESYAYDGRTLSEFGDVVVVSVNHRLNILGTLDLSAYGPQYANSRYTGTADLVVGAAVGARQHRELRRRSRQRDDLRAVRRRRQSRPHAAHAGREGPLPQGVGAERRQQHLPHDRSRREHQGAADDRGPHAQEPEPHGRPDRQAEDRALHGADYRRHRRAAVGGRRKLGRPALNWEVIADDQYVMREFCDWADTIPLMAGAVFSEMQGTLTRGDGRKNEWSQKEIDDQLTAAFGDKKNDIVAEFKQAFPRKKVQDVLYYAGGSRPGVKNLLARKLEKSKAPVYNYLFAWEYPINGGITSFHCSELAFCFHALNVPQIRTATGGGPVGDGAAGQGRAGVGQLRQDGQSEPARARVEAVHEGEPAGDGVRHRQPVGRAPRRQAGVAAAGAGRPGRRARPRRGTPPAGR